MVLLYTVVRDIVELDTIVKCLFPGKYPQLKRTQSASRRLRPLFNRYTAKIRHLVECLRKYGPLHLHLLQFLTYELQGRGYLYCKRGSKYIAPPKLANLIVNR
jgi:hypothetical protein